MSRRRRRCQFVHQQTLTACAAACSPSPTPAPRLLTHLFSPYCCLPNTLRTAAAAATCGSTSTPRSSYPSWGCWRCVWWWVEANGCCAAWAAASTRSRSRSSWPRQWAPTRRRSTTSDLRRRQTRQAVAAVQQRVQRARRRRVARGRGRRRGSGWARVCGTLTWRGLTTSRTRSERSWTSCWAMKRIAAWARTQCG